MNEASIPKMTSFHDSSRRRIGGHSDGRSCWLAAYAALPALHILPVAAKALVWDVDIILDGAWKSIQVTIEQLPRLLLEWNDGPEEALRVWWGCEAPSGRGSAEGAGEPCQIVQADPDDLGL